MNDFEKKCKIEENVELGRYVTAAVDLKPGETILVEQPILIFPIAGQRRCANCFRLTDGFCSNCQIFPLCDICTQHNEFDCQFLVAFKLKQSTTPNSPILNLQRNPDIYGALKCLLLRENPATVEYYKKFMHLEAHLKERKDTEIWLEHQKKVVEPFFQSGLLDYINEINNTEKIDAELLQRWCGIFDVNSFEIRAPDGESMRAIYLSAALLAHHCVANTAVAIDDQYQMKIYANRDIQQGEMLHYCYTNVLLGTAERRHLLEVGKYFHCKCERCEDPTELGSHLSSLICSPCAGNKLEGFIVKNAQRQWQCLQCEHTLKTEFVESILERAKEEIFHAKDDIYRYELLLAKLSRILHPNHYLMMDMKQNIAAILRSIIMNLAHRPGRKVYDRKVKLCQEIMGVLKIIQPGISRLKGIALYELCNSMAELSRMKFNEQEFNADELVQLLKHCEGMLRESIRLLLYEPVDTPEGKLAKNMIRELKDLQNDINLAQHPMQSNANAE